MYAERKILDSEFYKPYDTSTLKNGYKVYMLVDVYSLWLSIEEVFTVGLKDWFRVHMLNTCFRW